VKRLVSILVCLIALSSHAQDCYIDLYFPPKAFKKHKVKEVKATMVQNDSSLTRTHLFTYQLHPNDVFYRGLRHSPQGYTETACNCDKDSLHFTMTTTSYDDMGNKIPISRVTKEYSKDHKLLSHSYEELMGNYIRHIRKFNPLDTTETYIEVIAFMGNDTSEHSINKQNSREFLMIARSKKDGVSVVKKQHVTYENGKVVRFDEFLDGKLVFTRKGDPDENAIIRKRVDPESQNALPYNDLIYNDTLKVDVKEMPEYFRKALGSTFKEKKVIKVIHYYWHDKKLEYGYDFLYMNKLPIISYVLNLKTFMLYEYSFYK
jgi:hypothetical protein